jgi:hypothetical protein
MVSGPPATRRRSGSVVSPGREPREPLTARPPPVREVNIPVLQWICGGRSWLHSHSMRIAAALERYAPPRGGSDDVRPRTPAGISHEVPADADWQTKSVFWRSQGVAKNISARVQIAHTRVRFSDSRVRSADSRVRGADSGVRCADSRVRGADWGVRSADSRVRCADSRVRGADSGVSGADSRVRGADSRVRGSDSRVRGADSRVRGADSRVRGADSRVRGADSDLRGADSSVRGYVPAGRPRGEGLEMSIMAIRSFSSYQQWKRLMPGTSMS